MKKVCIMATVIILILIGIFMVDFNKNRAPEVTNVVEIENSEAMMKEYVLSLEEETRKEEVGVENQKTFVAIEEVGSEKEGDNTIVYAWILIETYGEKDGAVEMLTGSSMPYRFVIKDDTVIEYQVPEDGDEYVESTKKLFPEDIREKLSEIDAKGELRIDLEEQVNEFYENK